MKFNYSNYLNIRMNRNEVPIKATDKVVNTGDHILCVNRVTKGGTTAPHASQTLGLLRYIISGNSITLRYRCPIISIEV